MLQAVGSQVEELRPYAKDPVFWKSTATRFVATFASPEPFGPGCFCRCFLSPAPAKAAGPLSVGLVILGFFVEFKRQGRLSQRRSFENDLVDRSDKQFWTYELS